MPPELLTNDELSPATDAFSFGVVLWEMMSGRRAWRGLAPLQVGRCRGRRCGGGAQTAPSLAVRGRALSIIVCSISFASFLTLIHPPLQVINAVTLERRTLPVPEQWPAEMRVRGCGGVAAALLPWQHVPLCLLGTATSAAILTSQSAPAPVPRLPLLQALVKRCLAYEPSQRPTATELYQALQAMKRSGGGGSAPASPVPT